MYDMSEWIKNVSDNLPFMACAMQAAHAGKVNTTRIIEAVLIALVTAGVIGIGGYLIAWPKLTDQVEYIRGDLTQIKQDIAQTKNEISGLRERAAGTEADVRNLQRR